MGRVYSATFTAVAVTAAQDFFEINAPSTAAVRLLSCHIGQSSDAGDAEAEMLRVRINRSTGVSGSGGTTPTAAPHIQGDSSFAGTVEANNTTIATTLTVLHADTFNVQAGWHYQPIPEEMHWIRPSGRLTVQLVAAPADSLTMSGTITFESFG